MKKTMLVVLALLLSATGAFSGDLPAGGSALGTRSYADYEEPALCGDCHTDFFRQWEQALMSQAFTHPWDEIEYFALAVPHAEKDPRVAEVKAGCNGCHAPLAFMAGDIPPPRPSENSRANESVSCDFCHTISGFDGDVPYNFNYISSPGGPKYGPKPGLESPQHDTEQSEFLSSTEFCGTCHNEKSPYGVWVKATQLEWKNGPYAEEGVRCQDCHMPAARARSAESEDEDWVAQHLFHGAHDPGKLAGAVELRVHPVERRVRRGDSVVLRVQLFNAKAGHMIPSGSVEDRIVWLHVSAEDSRGRTFHLPVDRKGFEGEEYTVAGADLAYQDLGVPLEKPGFEGLPRDGVPAGDRIFRMPYFDPQGRMTIMQWNTKSLGVDYRLGPRETKIESFTWQVPEEVAPGRVNVDASLNYRRLVQSVAEFLGVPAEEIEPVRINSATTWVEVYD
jgi:hypothetical protein